MEPQRRERRKEIAGKGKRESMKESMIDLNKKDTKDF
jgi:hypothetical protein